MSITFRIIVASLVISMLATAGIAATSATANEREAQLHSVPPGSVGLVMDGRRNLYTANRNTGQVYCMPPGQAPILYGRVPGIPTSIAMDNQQNLFIGTSGGVVFRISEDGTMTETYRSETHPVGLNVDRDGGLIIATKTGKIIKVARSEFNWEK